MTSTSRKTSPALSRLRTGSTKNLEIAKQKVPLEKLICAVGNYGYDWYKNPRRNPPANLKNTNVTVQEAWIAARDFGSRY